MIQRINNVEMTCDKYNLRKDFLTPTILET